MKNVSLLPAVLLLSASIAFAGGPGRLSSEVYDRTPLAFEKTLDGTSGFISRAGGLTLRVAPREASLSITRAMRPADRLQLPRVQAASVLMSLAGATGGELEGLDPLAGETNYLLGNRRQEWRKGFGRFAMVRSRSVYPGIDLIYYGNQRSLEFDFRIAPGANPGLIRMNFAGAGSLRIDDAGNLLIGTPAGEILQHSPRLYQESEGARRAVSGRYVLCGKASVAFEVGAYDRSRTLVIDPVLTYSTYLGGTRGDSATAVAVDNAGNLYVAGNTYSTNFPVSGSPLLASNQGAGDLFVAKYDSKGAVVYTTYIGGSGTEILGGIAVDSTGSVYLAGTTDSTNFPTVNALQTMNRGGTLGLDGFVAKLDPTGSQFIYSTYLGGNIDDLIFGIAVDGAGNAYVTGTTASVNFPVSIGAYQNANRGILNCFVTKLSATGSAYVYSTFVGGTRTDVPGGIVVDDAGYAYVIGDTSSSNFPTTANALQTTYRGGGDRRTDAFLFKLNPTATGLVYSTLLGGAGDEVGVAVAVDATGNAYVTGKTVSTDFPVTAGSLQSSVSGPEDAFVAKVNPTGTVLLYSTLLGGTRSERPFGIVLDKAGNVYVGGITTSTNFPLAAPFQAASGGGVDGFITKLDPTGTKILQSTYLGGNGDETLTAIALDKDGNLCVVGDTDSDNFPVSSGALQTRFGGNYDAFIARVSFAAEAMALTVSPARLDFQGQVGGTVAGKTLTVVGPAGVSVPWSLETATASGGSWLAANPKSASGGATVQIAITPASLQAGTYNGTLTITNQATGAKTSVPVSLTLTAVNQGGQITQNGVVNAASFQPGPVAPGELITIFGSKIGPPALVGGRFTAQDLLDNSLSETRVLFDGMPAPLLYVSEGQASAIVPYSVAGKTSTSMSLEYKSLPSNTVSLPVADCAPAIFTAKSSGKGQGSIANQDYSINSAANPAAPGSIVMLYATGEGQTDPTGIDGKPARAVYPKPVLSVTATIGGVNADVLYAGAAPEAVAGVLQVNLRIPETIASGDQPIAISVGGKCTSPAGVTVAVK